MADIAGVVLTKNTDTYKLPLRPVTIYYYILHYYYFALLLYNNNKNNNNNNNFRNITLSR